MPRPTDPARYPDTFAKALDRAYSEGSLVIPTTEPRRLRMQLYGYLKAVRAHGKAELANAIEVLTRPDSCVLRRRDFSPAARELRAALESSSTPEPEPYAPEESLRRILSTR